MLLTPLEETKMVTPCQRVNVPPFCGEVAAQGNWLPTRLVGQRRQSAVRAIGRGRGARKWKVDFPNLDESLKVPQDAAWGT